MRLCRASTSLGLMDSMAPGSFPVRVQLGVCCDLETPTVVGRCSVHDLDRQSSEQDQSEVSACSRDIPTQH